MARNIYINQRVDNPNVELYMMDEYSTIISNELLTLAAIRMSCRSTRLSETQERKFVLFVGFHLLKKFKITKSIETLSTFSVFREGGGFRE